MDPGAPIGAAGTARALAWETLNKWIEDRGPERGAALSFYVLLSLGPLLALVVGALELLASEATVRPAIVEAIGSVAGGRAATTAETILSGVSPPDLLSPGSLLTLGTLLFAATAAFVNIRGALHDMWGVAPQVETLRERVLAFLRGRWRGFVMICFTGALVVLSFLVTSLASVAYEFLRSSIPVGLPVVRVLDAVLTIGVLGLLFGVIFRTLPGLRVEWSSIWVGAFGTATLFVVGKILVTPFFSIPAWTSYYGPGTSVVAFLAWVYFSAQVFFLGAEFTQVWSRHRGGVLDRRRGTPSAGPVD
jgi:membrane protein